MVRWTGIPSFVPRFQLRFNAFRLSLWLQAAEKASHEFSLAGKSDLVVLTVAQHLAQNVTDEPPWTQRTFFCSGRST